VKGNKQNKDKISCICWKLLFVNLENKKDCKGASKIFIVKFTSKYKQLLVEEYSILPDLPHAAA
jgi:hypothetical protein